jgi:hypothetical protein
MLTVRALFYTRRFLVLVYWLYAVIVFGNFLARNERIMTNCSMITDIKLHAIRDDYVLQVIVFSVLTVYQ